VALLLVVPLCRALLCRQGNIAFFATPVSPDCVKISSRFAEDSLRIVSRNAVPKGVCENVVTMLPGECLGTQRPGAGQGRQEL
jgi:hypothetical protein